MTSIKEKVLRLAKKGLKPIEITKILREKNPDIKYGTVKQYVWEFKRSPPEVITNDGNLELLKSLHKIMLEKMDFVKHPNEDEIKIIKKIEEVIKK